MVLLFNPLDSYIDKVGVFIRGMQITHYHHDYCTTILMRTLIRGGDYKQHAFNNAFFGANDNSKLIFL